MDTDTVLLVAAEWIGVVAVGMLAGISPQLSKIRPLKFLFPRREASITFSLIAVMFVFSILLYWRFFTAANQFGTINPQYLIQRVILDIITFAIFGTAIFTRKQPLRSALWGKDAFRPNIQFGLLLAALVIFLRGKVFAITNGVNPQEGLALLQLLVISACEITIFFGYAQPRLMGRFGDLPGWLLSAGFFALWQIIPLALHGYSGQAVIFQIALAIGQGLILGWITRKSRHILAPVLYLTISQWLFLIK